MTDDEILRGIGEIAERELGWRGVIRRELRLAEEMALDSLRLTTLAVAVENRFEICLSPEDEEGIETIDDLLTAIRRAGGAAAGS